VAAPKFWQETVRPHVSTIFFCGSTIVGSRASSCTQRLTSQEGSCCISLTVFGSYDKVTGTLSVPGK